MANTTTTATSASPSMRAAQVYAMAGLCLVAGLGIGFVSMGWQSHPSRPKATPAAAAALPLAGPAQLPAAPQGILRPAPNPSQPNAGPASPHSGTAMPAGKMPTLADMKQMADKKAEPLLAKLKTDPNNLDVLMQVASIYHTTHQFHDAAKYYRRAVEVDPKNVALRTKLAASLYRAGDVDGGIAQLKQALTYDPKDANALFDLGMMRLQGKQDGKGALAAWQLLLKSNPQLSSERRATVEKIMADVMTTLADQSGTQGAGGSRSKAQ